MSAAEALLHCKEQLTLYEQSEVLNYSAVYFVGQVSAKRSPGVLKLNNFGFDDEQGHYLTQPGDQVQYRYEVQDVLGTGSFGKVFKVLDHKLQTELALKVVRNQAKFEELGRNEIKLLSLIKDKTHRIVSIREFFHFRNHVCMTFELLGPSLYDSLRNRHFQGFREACVRRYAEQLLLALAFLRRFDVVHSDVKPENVLFAPGDSLKLIDFGSSCFSRETKFSYIQSRYYRAPEVILGMPYSYAIDMWSLGCLLAELYTGKPIFPGECEKDQLYCIIEVLGLPPLEMYMTSKRTHWFFSGSGALRPFKSKSGSLRGISTCSLEEKLPGASIWFLHFLRQCFEWSPGQRLSPEQALAHSWVGCSAPTSRHRRAATHY